jgi:hypothetical protein
MMMAHCHLLSFLLELHAGSFFNCVLPESIKVSAVTDVNGHPDFSGTLPPTPCFTYRFLNDISMLGYSTISV